jgi:hypothetical protein
MEALAIERNLRKELIRDPHMRMTQWSNLIMTDRMILIIRKNNSDASLVNNIQNIFANAVKRMTKKNYF